MKKCTHCGVENPDGALQCGTCHATLPASSSPAPPEPAFPTGISAEEQAVWRRMTFREFFILLLRLQAVWLLFYAALDLTYLLPWLVRLLETPSYAAGSRGIDSFLWPVLRLVLRVAAAFALIQQAERVASWFVKDWVPSKKSRSAVS